MSKTQGGTITFRITDDGTLKLLSKDAKKAGKSLGDTGRNAATLDRNMKGASKQSSGATKNFSKMAQGISGGLVPAYAELAAQFFALSAVFRALKDAADFRVLNQGMTAFAAVSGTMSKTMAKNFQEATGFQIDFRNAAQQTAIMFAAGFSPEQMNSVAVAAKAASTALGRDFEDSLNRLVRGITKAEPELLDELGIILRLERATTNYALQVGKTAKDLNTFERSQAVLIETLRQAEEKYGAVGDAVPVNQFNKLIAVFIDLKDEALNFITPVAESIAGFFTTNITSAVAAMAIFASTLLRGMLPALDQLDAKINNSMIGKLANFDVSSKFGDTKLRSAKSSVQRQAQDLTSPAAMKSSSIQALKQGKDLTKQQLTGLKSALKKAENEYRKHGKITTGIFTGEDIKRVRGFRRSLRLMEMESRKSSSRIIRTFRFMGRGILLVLKGTAKAVQIPFRMMVGGAKLAARGMNMAFRAVAIFGFVTLAIDAFKALQANFDKVLGFFATVLDKVSGLMLRFAGLVSKLFPKIGKAIEEGASKLSEKAEEMRLASQGEGEGFLADKAREAQQKRAADTVSAAYEDIKTKITDAKQELFDMRKEQEKINTIDQRHIENLKRKKDLDEDAKKARLKTIKLEEEALQRRKEQADVALIASAGLTQMAQTLETAETKKFRMEDGTLTDENFYSADQLASLRDEFISYATSVGVSNSAVAELVQRFSEGKVSTAEFVKEMQTIETTASAQNAAIKSFNANLESLQKGFNQLIVRDSMDQLLSQFEIMKDSIEEGATVGTATEDSLIKQMFDTLFPDSDVELVKDMKAKIETVVDDLQSVVDERQRILLDRADINIEKKGLSFRKDAAAKLRGQELRKEELQLVADTANNELKLLEAVESQEPAHLRKIALQKKAVELAESERDAYSKSITAVEQLNQTFLSGLESAFAAVATGAKTMEEALKSLADAVVAEMARIAAQQLVAGLMGLVPGGGDGDTPKGEKTRYGGIVSNSGKSFRYGGMAVGGVASGPESGYNVTMHGTEAVVPLGNDRSIPVKLQGGMGNINNTNVVVNVDADGNAQVNGEQQAKSLGAAIQSAVTEEIVKQQRPGGLLSNVR